MVNKHMIKLPNIISYWENVNQTHKEISYIHIRKLKFLKRLYQLLAKM